VFAVCNAPVVVPAGAIDLEIMCSVGHEGARLTAIPRKTVILNDIPKTSFVVAAIPPRATEVTLASLDQAAAPVPSAITLRFFDWFGNLVGSTYLSPTSTPRPIDLPQGATLVKVFNNAGVNVDAALLFRIAL
jgi:hypothetical protein